MEKKQLTRITYLFAVIAIVLVCSITGIKSCSEKSNPAVDRLETINDSLYYIIGDNNHKVELLYAKIDSLNAVRDTIIEKQSVTTKIYKNEVYNIVYSSAAVADSLYRATLNSSDSLYKQGFYSITYDLRSQAFKSQLP